MSKRFSITLTDRQADALKQYSKERWAQPSDIIRTALFTYLRAKAFFKQPNQPKIGDRMLDQLGIRSLEESCPKVDFGHLGEVFQTLPVDPPKSFPEIARRKLFWPLMRLKVFERDSYKCRSCGSDGEGNLHVHHILKRKDGGRDVEENLVTLCALCHSRADHGLLDDPEGIWRQLRKV